MLIFRQAGKIVAEAAGCGQDLKFIFYSEKYQLGFIIVGSI